MSPPVPLPTAIQNFRRARKTHRENRGLTSATLGRGPGYVQTANQRLANARLQRSDLELKAAATKTRLAKLETGWHLFGRIRHKLANRAHTKIVNRMAKTKADPDSHATLTLQARNRAITESSIELHRMLGSLVPRLPEIQLHIEASLHQIETHTPSIAAIRLRELNDKIGRELRNPNTTTGIYRLLGIEELLEKIQAKLVAGKRTEANKLAKEAKDFNETPPQ